MFKGTTTQPNGYPTMNPLKRRGTKILLLTTFCSMFLIWNPYVESFELKAQCGFPGKPYRAKIIPEEKLIFSEGEVVSYQCVDYWAPPQTRKCLKGEWVGPVAKCGDFVPDLLMRHSQLFDLSAGHEVFNYRNMNITNTDWKYPNSFTSNRFKLARLRINDDHLYLWKFQFTHPAVKLYVHINVNFLNFTVMSEEWKQKFLFHIEVEISPYRSCKLDYQSNNLWRQNGNRIDSFFSCEANSPQDMVRDAEKPSNYMVMRTQASDNITHELVAVFFGRSYGNESEPLCGEPEVRYGQSFRANQENRDYMVDCTNQDEWVDINPDPVKKFIYMIRCIGDMEWNGTVPRCIPSKTCPLDNINQLSGETGSNQTKSESSHLVIDSIHKFFYLPDNDTIYATAGTELVYNCDSEDYILVGRDTRTCKRDHKWTGHEPVCRFIKSSNELIESSNNLLVIIVCMGGLLVLILVTSCVLLLVYNRRQRRNKRRRREQESDKEQHRARLEKQYSLNIYDNIEMNGKDERANGDEDDGLYEIYEHITDDQCHYSPVSDNYNNHYIEPSDRYSLNHHHQTIMVNPTNNQNYSAYDLNDPSSFVQNRAEQTEDLDEEDDEDENNTYIRMLRDSRKYANIKSNLLHRAPQPPTPSSSDLRILATSNGRIDTTTTTTIRNQLDNRRMPEPSYLELIGSP